MQADKKNIDLSAHFINIKDSEVKDANKYSPLI